MRLAKLFRMGCGLIAAVVCLVPALHAAQAHLCCPQSASACCSAASEPAAAESSLTAQPSTPDRIAAAGAAPAPEWARSVPPVELHPVRVVNLQAPPGAPAFAAVLRI